MDRGGRLRFILLGIAGVFIFMTMDHLTGGRGDGPEDPKAPWNVAYDSLDFTLDRADGRSCAFSYRDPKVEVHRVVAATGRPYELEVDETVKNLAGTPLRHEVSVDTVAWRT